MPIRGHFRTIRSLPAMSSIRRQQRFQGISRDTKCAHAQERTRPNLLFVRDRVNRSRCKSVERYVISLLDESMAATGRARMSLLLLSPVDSAACVYKQTIFIGRVMKKNIRKVPQDTLKRLHSFELVDIVDWRASNAQSNTTFPRYPSLGLKLVSGSLKLPQPFVPKPSAGSYSKANVEGKDIPLKHLPKITRTNSWETANWGDWSKGSHTHSTTRLVYQRDFCRPKEVELSIELLETLPQ